MKKLLEKIRLALKKSLKKMVQEKRVQKKMVQEKRFGKHVYIFFYGSLWLLLACPGLTDHPTGAPDMLLSQNEEPSELFNSRWVPWSNS